MSRLRLLWIAFQIGTCLTAPVLAQSVPEASPRSTVQLVPQDAVPVEPPALAPESQPQSAESPAFLMLQPSMRDSTSDLLSPINYCASSHGNGEPHCLNTGCGSSHCNGRCCQACSAEDTYWQQFKARKQACYWGYCQYFDERAFGICVEQAMEGQIRAGIAAQSMLYDYDFYAQDSDRVGQLTPRGRWQLTKIVSRMQSVPGPVLIEIDEDDPALNEARRLSVVAALADTGIANPEQFVLFAQPRFGWTGLEAIETAEALITSARRRGRTVSPGEQSTFGRGVSVGFSN
jgi:hypothetical protein